MGNLMNQKNGELREKIIAVAGEMFKQQGFEKTSMDQIAAEAMVSREILDNYFPIKEAVADAYCQAITESIARTTLKALPKLPDTRSRLIAAIGRIYEWAEVNAELARAVMIYRLKILGVCTIFEDTGTQNIIAEIVRRGRDEGELRNDIPLEWVLAYIDYLGSAILLDWLKSNNQRDLRGKIGSVVDMILFGIPGKPET